MRVPGWLYVLALAPALSSVVPAQDAACLRRTVPLAATDKGGYAFTALNPEDLQGELGGKPIRPLALKRRNDPALMILLDISRYMRDRPVQWEHAWGLAMEAARTMPRQSPLALVLFTDRLQALVQGHDRVISQLLAIKAAPPEAAEKAVRTGPLDTMGQVLDRIAQPRVGDTIYLVTGNGDNVAGDLQASLRTRLLATGVRLFAVLVQPVEELNVAGVSSRPRLSRDFAVRSQANAWLRAMALDSGGDFYLDLGNATLNVVNWRLQEHVTPMYELTLELPARLSKAQSLKLHLRPAEKTRGLTLYYPQQLAGCEAK